MTRIRPVAIAALVICTLVHADNKDTPAATKTKTERFKVKVTVEWKNLFLRECLAELVSAMDDAGLGKIEIKNAVGVSLNTRMTYSAKDKTIGEVMEEFLKTNDLTFDVISKKGDKSDGGLLIKKK